MKCGCSTPVRIHWLGMDWLGLPMPVRVGVWVWAAFAGRTDDTLEAFVGRFAGCGCIAALKRLFGE